MTTYTAISDATLSQDKPATQSTFRALRDNPLAIAQGDTTAPRIAPKALGGLAVGSILLAQSSASVAATATNPTFTKLKEILVPYGGTYTISVDYSVGGGYGAVLQFYIDGVAYGTAQNISGGGTYSQNIALTAGQKIQCYANGGSAGATSSTFISNFKVSADQAAAFVVLL